MGCCSRLAKTLLNCEAFWSSAFSFVFKKETIYVAPILFAGNREAAQNDGAARLSD